MTKFGGTFMFQFDQSVQTYHITRDTSFMMISFKMKKNSTMSLPLSAILLMMIPNPVQNMIKPV